MHLRCGVIELKRKGISNEPLCWKCCDPCVHLSCLCTALSRKVLIERKSKGERSHGN